MFVGARILNLQFSHLRAVFLGNAENGFDSVESDVWVFDDLVQDWLRFLAVRSQPDYYWFLGLEDSNLSSDDLPVNLRDGVGVKVDQKLMLHNTLASLCNHGIFLESGGHDDLYALDLLLCE